jgi:ABC-2 type transport system permease protein
MNISLTRLLAIFNIRNKEFYRDKGALAWVFLFPIMMIVAFGYMFDPDEQALYKVGYSGQSDPSKVKMISFIKYEDKDQALLKLKNQLLDLYVDFNHSTPIYYKAEESPKSFLAEQLYLNQFKKLEPNAPTLQEVSGRKVKYIDWVFPGIICMNVMFMSMWGVGWVVVRQRKIGVLKRFKASPIKPIEYLLAQMLSRLVIISISGTIVFAGAHLIYPFHTEGSYLSIFFIYILGAFSLSSFGLIVASRSQSEELANGLLNFLTYPMMFLSEVWFSLEGSAEWVKTAAKTMPLWHMIDGIRRIMNEGATLVDLIPSITILITISVVFTTLGAYFFKWNKD